LSWNQQFFEPIPLPKGKPLVTLRDAALYITKLPKAQHDAPEWQAAMEALLKLNFTYLPGKQVGGLSPAKSGRCSRRSGVIQTT
jgi:hypothetical protein